MNYYSHHIGDYIKKTVFLTNEQDLAYRRLLEMYYDTELPIPKETHSVSIRLRVACDALELVLSFFFTLENDGWHNKRCDEEIAEYRHVCETNAKNGKKGGRPKNSRNRVKKPNRNRMGYESQPNGNPLVSEINPNQEPLTKSHINNADALLLGTSAPSAVASPKRATQFPIGWKPAENHRAIATAEGKDCDREAIQFEDHHRSKGSVFKSWDLAFNTWLRNNYGSRRANSSPPIRQKFRPEDYAQIPEDQKF